MIKRKRTLLAAVVVIIIFSISALWLLPKKQQPDDMLPVQLTAIKTANGWGYEIFVDNKIYIKQDNIPAVSGIQSFKNKEQALAVGNLAMKKLVSGKIPSITIKDLKTLGVVE